MNNYMPREEVQARLGGRSPGALRQLVHRKRIPHRKIAGRVVFIREEIEEFVETAPGVRLEELRQRESA